ncbi:hypothetical protein D9M68_483240 [compost metagenome]
MVDVELSAAKINPATKQPIKENETIPMWSLNTETGQWKQEGTATVVKNPDGKLVGRMQITHLSDWGLFYIYTPCTTSVTINRTTDEGYETFIVYGGLLIDFVSFNPGEKSKTFTVDVWSDQSSITVSTFGSFNIGPYNSIGAKYENSTQTKDVSNVCGQTYAFNFVAKPELINVDVNVMFKCTSKDLLTGINSFITISPIGSTTGESQSYYLTNGKGSGQILNGVTYKITAQVDDKIYTSQFTASKDNFILPSGFDLTGTATYNTLTNRLMIDGIVKKECN